MINKMQSIADKRLMVPDDLLGQAYIQAKSGNSNSLKKTCELITNKIYE